MGKKKAYIGIRKSNNDCLRGRVRIPTGGDSPRAGFRQDLVKFQNRQCIAFLVNCVKSGW